MTLTIGRAAVDNPEKVSSSGGRITLEGDIAPANGTDAANVDEFLARRQQLVAMVDNPDMDVWPVTWTEDDTLDGFYRVRRAEADPASVYLATGVGRYRVELERPVGLVAPLVEATTMSLIMTNTHGVTSASAKSIWAVPGAAATVDSPAMAGTQPAAGSRSADDGVLKLTRVGAGQSTGRWVVAAEDFWAQAAKISAAFSGSTLWPIPGRLLVPGKAWEISNGIVRLAVYGTGVGVVSFFDGTDWTADQVFNIRLDNGVYGMYCTPVGVTILRNSPELCALRLVLQPALPAGIETLGYATLDVAVRRGDAVLRCILGQHTIAANAYIAVGSSGGTQTTLTAGVRGDATVGAGRVLIAHPATATSYGVGYGNPQVLLPYAAPMLFGIGYEIGGASASTYNAAQQVIYQYLASLSETQRVVLR